MASLLKYLCTAGCIFWIQAFWAQPSFHYIEKLTTSEGLSSNAIMDVVQDSKGFLWIATRYGLNRYDGTEVKQYLTNSGDIGIADNTIYRLLKADSFHIVIATGHGLSILDIRNNTFKNIEFPTDSVWKFYDNQVLFLEKDKQGNFWAGTPTCIYRLDKTLHLQKTFRYGYLPDDIGKQRLHAVYKIIPLSTGDVLFWMEHGIQVWHPGQDTLISISNRPSSPWYFLKGLSFSDCFQVYGHYLIYFNYLVHRMYVYDEQTGQRASCSYLAYDQEHIPWNHYVSTLKDGWIAISFNLSGFALARIENENGKLSVRYNRHPYFSGHTFRKWKTDDEGNLWTTSKLDGLMKISPEKQFFRYKTLTDNRTGQPSKFEIENFYRLGHRLFIASYGDGFYEWNIVSGKLIHHSARFGAHWENMVWNFRLHDQNTLWIGTQQGLLWYNMRNKKMGRLLQPHPLVLDSSFAITTQFTDSKGLVWMGIGHGRGLCVYDPFTKKFRLYPHADTAYPYRYPLSIAEDSNTNLWFLSDATPNLVQWIRKENRFRIIKIPGFKGTTYIHTGGLYLDKKTGFMWYGIESEGLVRYNIYTGSVKTYGMDRGLSTGMISSIQQDKNGILWLAATQGISSFDPVTEHFINYNKADGLPATYFSALYYDTISGIMYAGAPGKAIYFSPREFRKKRNPMRVQLTALMINDQQAGLPENRRIKLSWRNNDITISFTGINLTNGVENKYAYRLGAEDAEWVDIGKQRQIRFASLNPGHYIFSVRAARKNGTWSPLTDHLDLVIRPPFIRTIWFYLFIILLIAGTIYAWYRYRLRQLMKLETMRSRISHDLHDDIGSRLTNISLMSLIARREQHDDSKIIHWLDEIHLESQEISRSMREIVWNINPANDSLEEATPRMLRYATDMLEIRSMNVKASLPEFKGIKMKMEERRDLFLIFKETINNIANHSEAKNVTIFLTIKDQLLCLQVIDDGKGFDKAGLPFINGLEYMHQRATLHHWNFTVHSNPGQGTQVSLEIKIE